MNIVALTGRMTADPEIRELGEKKTKQCEITLAVDKMHYRKDSDNSANFPMIQLWGKQAEFIEKWCKKGTKLEITGELETQTYTNRNGDKVFKTFVKANTVSFAESRRAQAEASVAESSTEEEKPLQTQQEEPQTYSEPKQPEKKTYGDEDDFMHIPEGFDEDSVPFS